MNFLFAVGFFHLSYCLVTVNGIASLGNKSNMPLTVKEKITKFCQKYKTFCDLSKKSQETVSHAYSDEISDDINENENVNLKLLLKKLHRPQGILEKTISNVKDLDSKHPVKQQDAKIAKNQISSQKRDSGISFNIVTEESGDRSQTAEIKKTPKVQNMLTEENFINNYLKQYQMSLEKLMPQLLERKIDARNNGVGSKEKINYELLSLVISAARKMSEKEHLFSKQNSNAISNRRLLLDLILNIVENMKSIDD